MKTIQTLLLPLLATIAIATWSTTAHAQIGGTGDTGTGNTGTGNTGTGNTGTGTTGNTGTGSATGGAGIQTVPDTSAFDQIQRGDSIGSAAASGFGPAATQNGGRASAFGGLGGGGGFGGGGLGGLGGLFGGGGFGAGAQSTKPTIRTRLRSAVQVAPMSAQQVQYNANRRIFQLPQRRGMQNVRINMVGRTAVIEGTATSDRDRRMTELLMRLEPGVSQIQNNLRIQP